MLLSSLIPTLELFNDQLITVSIPEGFNEVIRCTSKLLWTLNSEGFGVRKALLLHEALSNQVLTEQVSLNIQLSYKDVTQAIAQLDHHISTFHTTNEALSHVKGQFEEIELLNKIARYKLRYQQEAMTLSQRN